MPLGAAVIGQAAFAPRKVVELPWTAAASDAGQLAVWIYDPATHAVVDEARSPPRPSTTRRSCSARGSPAARGRHRRRQVPLSRRDRRAAGERRETAASWLCARWRSPAATSRRPRRRRCARCCRRWSPRPPSIRCGSPASSRRGSRRRSRSACSAGWSSRPVNIGDLVDKGQTLAAIDPLVAAARRCARPRPISPARRRSSPTRSASPTGRTTLLKTNATTQAQVDAARRKAAPPRSPARPRAASRARQGQRGARLRRAQGRFRRRRRPTPAPRSARSSRPAQMVVDVADPNAARRRDRRAGRRRRGADASATPFEVAAQLDPSVRVAGEVREIAPQADAATRTRRVKIALDQSAERLPARLDHHRLAASPARARRCGCRPRRSSIKDGKPYVWIVDPDDVEGRDARRRRSATGDADPVEVTSGLEPAMRVVTAGVHSLRRRPDRQARTQASAVKPLQPLRMGARAPLARLVFHDRVRDRRRVLLPRPRPRGGPALHDQDHGRSRRNWPGATRRRGHQAGHRPDREEARGARIARLHPQRHHAGPDHRLRQPAATTKAKDVPYAWLQRPQHARRHPERRSRPASQGPFFNDEFGDVYGNIYAFTATA